MAKTVTKTHRVSSSDRVIGTTSDGVRILKPAVKPTSFTVAEIRKTMREVMSQPAIRAALQKIRSESSGA